MLNSLDDRSGNEIIKELGKRYSTYRKRMGYTQKQAAEISGLSVFTISTFENGTMTGLTLSSFIKLLRVIESVDEMDKLLPELPMSPRALFKQQKKHH